MTKLFVWHFLPEDGRVRYEGTKVVPGQTLRLPTGTRPVLCKTGYHGSTRAVDALRYALGSVVQRAVLSGDVLRGTDKACASERTCIAVADATAVLYEFACWCAERVLMRQQEAGRDPDARSWAAVAARRAWLRGDITDAQLAAAYAVAAGVALADASAYCGARNAARDARADARNAARNALADASAAAASVAMPNTNAAAASVVYAAAYADARNATASVVYAAVYVAAAERDAAYAAERAAQNTELEMRLCGLLEVSV